MVCIGSIFRGDSPFLPQVKQDEFQKLSALKKITVIALTALAKLGHLFCIQNPEERTWVYLIDRLGLFQPVKIDQISIDEWDITENYPDDIFTVFRNIFLRDNPKPLSNGQLDQLEELEQLFDEKLGQYPALKLDLETLGQTCIESELDSETWKKLSTIRYKILSTVVEKPLVLYFYDPANGMTDGKPVDISYKGTMKNALRIAIANEPS